MLVCDQDNIVICATKFQEVLVPNSLRGGRSMRKKIRQPAHAKVLFCLSTPSGFYESI